MADPADRAWELMQRIGICMLVTHHNDGQISARPMGATVRREEDAIYFLASADRASDAGIAINPSVGLSFADTAGQKYVFVTGHCEVSDDREKIRDLWTPLAKAWWDSPEDPDIRVLRVTPDEAEYWDSPGTLATYAKMVAAAVTGAKPKVGENRKVAL